jgi:hypothetical protein
LQRENQTDAVYETASVSSKIGPVETGSCFIYHVRVIQPIGRVLVMSAPMRAEEK